MGLFFFLDDGDMVRRCPPFREGIEAILPHKIGHMALLDNLIMLVSLRF